MNRPLCYLLYIIIENVKVLSSIEGLFVCQGCENYSDCNNIIEDWKLIPLHQYFHGFLEVIVLAFNPLDNI